MTRIFRGIGVSPGVACAPALIIRWDFPEVADRTVSAVWLLTGVSPRLVRLLRDALDREGFPYVGVIVSGGFTPKRIRAFEDAGVPVTGYGVGSSLLGHNKGEADGLLSNFDFTADIVAVDGRPESKVGRERRDNPRFVRVNPLQLAELDRERRERDG